MGLVHRGRALVRISLYASLGLAFALSLSCNSSNRDSVSSQSFLAPQLIAVDPNTGQDAQGQQAVEVLVDKLMILREVFREEDGTTPSDGVLKNLNPLLTVLGKIDEDRLLVYDGETNARVMLTIDLRRNEVRKVLTAEQVQALFRNLAQKPVFGPVVQLRSGWLLGFETQSRSLFAIRADASGPGVFANPVLSQSEIQGQLYPPPSSPPAVSFRHLVQFTTDGQREQVLAVPTTNTVTSLHRLEVQEGDADPDPGIVAPVLLGRFVILPDTELDTELKGFLTFDQIKLVTTSINVDVRDFRPIVVPGGTPLQGEVIIFDRAVDTSSFLALRYRRETFKGEIVYRASVQVAIDFSQIGDVIETNSEGEPLEGGQLLFTDSYYHPGALLDESSIDYEPLLLCWEDTTNTLAAIDYSRPNGASGKIFTLSSATQLNGRTDLREDPALDTGVFEPILTFATNDVDENRLVWDAGPGELISLNYKTGQWAVVLHRRDLSTETGVNLVSLLYVEALSGQTVRVVDFDSASVLGIRLTYVPIPVTVPPPK